MSRFCKQHHLEIQYFTVYNDVIYSTLLYLFLGLTGGGGGGEFGVLPVLSDNPVHKSTFFPSQCKGVIQQCIGPIQNTRHFLLESFVWEEAIHVTILWSEDSVA
jgi:hypothetical protein